MRLEVLPEAGRFLSILRSPVYPPDRSWVGGGTVCGQVRMCTAVPLWALLSRATCLFFLCCVPLLNHLYPSEFHFASFPFLSAWFMGETVEPEGGRPQLGFRIAYGVGQTQA